MYLISDDLLSDNYDMNDVRKFTDYQHHLLCDRWQDPIVKLGLSNEPQTYTSEDTEGDETSTGVEYDEVLNTDPDTVAESTELGTGSEPEGVREASDMVDSPKGGLNLHHNGTSPGDTDIPLIEVTLT